MKTLNYIFFVAVGASAVTPCLGYDLPAVNLGNTSFYDGMPAPAGPGWYITEYLTFLKSSRLNDASGNRLPLPRQQVNAAVSLTQLYYQSENKWNGVTPGFTALLPFVAHAEVDDGIGNSALKSRQGAGDIILGAALQFDPTMGEKGPIFSHRLELDLTLPTGSYSRNVSLSPGSNFWTLSPHWSFTAFASPQLSFSGRLHYLWNGVNDKPNISYGPQATTTRAGQAFHANLTAEYAVRPDLVLGLNSYLLTQTTDTKLNGVDVNGSRERVFAVGPGFLYKASPDTLIFVNAYSEFGARNRAEGSRIVARLVHRFK